MANSADPDQKPTDLGLHFEKVGYIRVQHGKGSKRKKKKKKKIREYTDHTDPDKLAYLSRISLMANSADPFKLPHRNSLIFLFGVPLTNI